MIHRKHHNYDKGEGQGAPDWAGRQNSPRAPFESCCNCALALLRPDTKLGKEVSRTLEVYLGDVWEPTQHTVHIGIDACKPGSAIVQPYGLEPARARVRTHIYICLVYVCVMCLIKIWMLSIKM